jgi:hypothetical protein
MQRDAHAVVLGAGIAGLLTARVLTETYDRVTITERDRFPDADSARRRVRKAGTRTSSCRVAHRSSTSYYPASSQVGATRASWRGSCSCLVVADSRRRDVGPEATTREPPSPMLGPDRTKTFP